MRTQFDIDVVKMAMFYLCDEHVTPRLRAFSIDVAQDWSELQCRFIYDGEPTEEEKERSGGVVGYMISANWQIIKVVKEEHVSCLAPQSMEHLRLRVYQRCERSDFDWAR